MKPLTKLRIFHAIMVASCFASIALAVCYSPLFVISAGMSMLLGMWVETRMRRITRMERASAKDI